jgi:Major capsid protein N-terminus
MFHSVFKRHTPFAMHDVKVPIQADTILVPKAGDLLSSIYITRINTSTGMTVQWNKSDVTDISLYIGGQLIDKHTADFTLNVYPPLMARTYAKSSIDPVNSLFFPLSFWFCHDLPLPILTLRDEIKLVLTWTPNPSYAYECYIKYISLGEAERVWFTKPLSIDIMTCQQIINHNDIVLRGPIKFIATPPIKIPPSFQYSIKMNGVEIRKLFNSHGAQLYRHTENAASYPVAQYTYPPIPLTGNSVYYSGSSTNGFAQIGTFSVAASSNTSQPVQSMDWFSHDGDDTTAWASSGNTGSMTCTYTASASSNNVNAYLAFCPSGQWISTEDNYLTNQGYLSVNI